MDKKVIILGTGSCGLTAIAIAEMKAKFPDAEVVTIEEAKERGLSETYTIKANPVLECPKIDVTPYLIMSDQCQSELQDEKLSGKQTNLNANNVNV